MDFVFEVLDHVGDLAVIDTGISQLVQKVEIKQAPVQAGLISVFMLAGFGSAQIDVVIVALLALIEYRT